MGLDLDIIRNKVATIERCIERIHEEYNNDPTRFENYTHQDAIILNLQRACEACIDLAMHICSKQKLGIPQTSGEAFEMLEKQDIITEKLSQSLRGMVGFRNVAVHDYQTLNLEILKNIIDHHLVDIFEFTEKVLRIKS